jgi:WD40 repeat protein
MLAACRADSTADREPMRALLTNRIQLLACGAIVCAAIGAGDAAQTPSSPDRLESVEQRTHSGSDALAFNPDGTVLASAYGGTVTLWDVETGLEVRTFERSLTRNVLDGPSIGHASFSSAGLAFDPTGRYVASTPASAHRWGSWNASSRVEPPNVWEARTGRGLSDVEWRYDAAQDRAIGSGFPFQAREPELWQYARDRESLSRMLAYRGPAQFFNSDGTLGAVVIGKDAYPWSPETIEIVDLGSGHVRWRWVMESKGLTRVIFSPDGRWVIATAFAHGSRIWDLRTGQPVDSSKFFGSERAHAIGFTPDGTRAVVVRWPDVCVISTSDATTISCPHTGDREGFGLFAISPDGRRLAAAREREVRVWDIQSGREVSRIALEGARPMLSMAVSPDGQWLSAGTDRDWYDGNHGSVLLWPLRGEVNARGMRLLWQDEDAAIQSVAFSPDSRRLVAASVGELRTGRSSGFLRGQVSLCTLPACDEVWELLDHDRRGKPPHHWLFPEAGAEGAVFTPDGKTLIAAVLGLASSGGEDNRATEFIPYSRLVFYDIADPAPVSSSTPAPSSPTSPWLPESTSDAPARERRVVRLRHPYRHLPPGDVYDQWSVFGALALSPDGRRVATAYDPPESGGRPVDLWSATTGRWVRRLGSDWMGTTQVEGVTGVARGLAFSPDGRWLATTGWDGNSGAFVAIWSTATGQLARTFGRDREEGDRAHLRVDPLVKSGQYTVAFHPDGTRLAVAECGNDYWERDRRARIMMWDVTGTSTRWSVETSGRCVEQLVFGPEGRWLAAVGPDGLMFRDAATGALLLTLAVRGTEHWAAWTPDGRYTGTDEGIARLIAVRDGVRARPLGSLPSAARVPDLFARVLDLR